MTKLFNNDANDFDARESVCCKRVLVVNERVLSGTQCNVALSINPPVNDALCHVVIKNSNNKIEEVTCASRGFYYSENYQSALSSMT